MRGEHSPTQPQNGDYSRVHRRRTLAAGHLRPSRSRGRRGRERTDRLEHGRRTPGRCGVARRRARRLSRDGRVGTALAAAGVVTVSRPPRSSITGIRQRCDGLVRIAGKPAPAPVEVWQRMSTAGAAGAQMSSLRRRSKAGEFRYVVEPGPARQFRFRYTGSPLTRGATAVVAARVRASTSIDVSRRDVVNGEYVTFSGRLRGDHIPATGKLVELQVFTRRRWRTFALPRADARTGRWELPVSVRDDSRRWPASDSEHGSVAKPATRSSSAARGSSP